MTPQEELFAKFYNEHKILVKDMDFVQLRENREMLSLIALEAKAKVVAADDELRERKAKTNNKEWLVTDTQQPYDVSAAINVVEKRKTRMNKIEKLELQLRESGLDDATVKSMIRNIEGKVTDGRLKTITFQGPAVETKVVQVQVKKEPSKPFDPTALVFKK